MATGSRDASGNPPRSRAEATPPSAPERRPAAVPAAQLPRRVVFDCLADAVFVVDAQMNRIVDANRTALERYGYSRGELLDRSPADLHVDEERDQAFGIGDRPHASAGKIFHHRTRDGFVMDVEIHARAIEYEGRPAWLAIVREIGGQLRQEEALRRARDEAERASRAKSEFLARMSHELRTPMNGILGMVELLLAGEPTGEQAESLASIQRCATTLLSLIDDLLDFSRAEHGRVTLFAAPFDLAAVMDAAVEPIALRAAQRGLELVVDVGVELPPCLVGDSGRIRQIVTNLVANAVKFTEQGHVLVQVRRDPETAPRPGHCAVRIEVSDTGPGVPAGREQAIFEPFVRGDDALTRHAGGSGLGLAICKQLAELMGGSIGLQAPGGPGATFWFRLQLPVAQDAGAAVRPPAALAGVRILLVGVGESTRRMLERRLHAWSMRVAAVAVDVAAQTLRAAAAAHREFGAVVLDMAAGGGTPAPVTAQVGQLLAAASALRCGVVLLTRPGQPTPLDGAGGPVVRLSTPIQLCALEQALRQGVRRTASGSVARTASGSASRGASGWVPAARLRGESPAEAPSGSFAAVDRRPLARDGRPLRALVVEDNPVNRRVIEFMLGAWGVRVECVEDGEAAVARTAAADFDLVLMDCQIPGLDGRRATEAIRARERERGQRVPIIGLTANAMRGDRELCLEAGMDDYLTKPFRAPELRALVERWAVARV